MAMFTAIICNVTRKRQNTITDEKNTMLQFLRILTRFEKFYKSYMAEKNISNHVKQKISKKDNYFLLKDNINSF